MHDANEIKGLMGATLFLSMMVFLRRFSKRQNIKELRMYWWS
jgi:hypothetical protein